jgi:hypothetical protein
MLFHPGHSQISLPPLSYATIKNIEFLTFFVNRIMVLPINFQRCQERLLTARETGVGFLILALQKANSNSEDELLF